MIPEKSNPNGNFPTTITDENKGSGLIIDTVQQDPSNRCHDGYHRGTHEDCERGSDYNIGNEKYYRYYYDDNDDNAIKIIKKSTK